MPGASTPAGTTTIAMAESKIPYSWDTAANQATHNYRGNDGALLDFVGTLDPRTVLTVRAGFNRYYTGSVFAPHDISSLGFPQPLLSQLQVKDKYPQIKFENYIQTSTDDADFLASDTYATQASLSKIM